MTRRLRADKPKRSFSRVAALAVVLLATLAGCDNDLPTYYGRAEGDMLFDAESSVNGTRVLHGMFHEAGHDVLTLDRFSKRLDDADCIVWFNPSGSTPSKRAREAFDNWLSQEPGRTVIYVGRGYDAAIDYWRDVRPLIDTGDAEQDRKLTGEARTRADESERFFSILYLQDALSPEDCEWYTIESRAPGAMSFEDFQEQQEALEQAEEADADEAPSPIFPDFLTDPNEEFGPDSEDDQNEAEDELEELFSGQYFKPTVATELSGEASWVDGVDVDKAKIQLYEKLHPGENMDVLLDSDAGMLVGRIERHDGQILVVANGSFLLNLPLVNKEHRKLAGRLIDQLGDESKRVCFLQAADIDFENPTGEVARPMGLLLLLTWPTNFIFFHLVAVGVLVVFTLFPIFGRPRKERPQATGDFGKHIAAMGDLLRKSDEELYVRSRIDHYRKLAEEHKRRR